MPIHPSLSWTFIGNRGLLCDATGDGSSFTLRWLFLRGVKRLVTDGEVERLASFLPVEVLVSVQTVVNTVKVVLQGEVKVIALFIDQLESFLTLLFLLLCLNPD